MTRIIGAALSIAAISIWLAVPASARVNDEVSAQSRLNTRAISATGGYCPEGTYSKAGTRWAVNVKNCSAANAPGRRNY
jgi:hypothetical protein